MEESLSMCPAPLSDRLEAVAASCPRISWGLAVRSGETGEVLGEFGADTVFSTASVGKVLLLAEAARQIESGTVVGSEPLDRRDVPPVADSGLWQHLVVDVLPLEDVCTLVGALSDNLATNVLLRRIGADEVDALAKELDLSVTALHDEVRDVRENGVPERLSSGSAAELSAFFVRLHQGRVVDAAVSARVRRWLSIDADLSMAASAYALDPLSHQAPDRGVDLFHKTGTDAGVRVDTGLVVADEVVVTYAFIANWDKAVDLRDEALRAMRELGDELVALAPPRA